MHRSCSSRRYSNTTTAMARPTTPRWVWKRCMYVRMYVCMYVCMHVCMCTLMHTDTEKSISTYVHVCIYSRMSIGVYADLYGRTPPGPPWPRARVFRVSGPKIKNARPPPPRGPLRQPHWTPPGPASGLLLKLPEWGYMWSTIGFLILVTWFKLLKQQPRLGGLSCGFGGGAL